VIAIAPLLTFFLALAHRQERWHMRPVFGSLLALAGIAVVFGEEVNAAVPLLPLLEIVATAFCIAESTVLAKGFPPVHIVTLNAVAMAVGTVFLAGLALVAGERVAVPARLDTWLAFWYLVLIGTVAVFLLFLGDTAPADVDGVEAEELHRAARRPTRSASTASPWRAGPMGETTQPPAQP
jgi:drug/metabolite transporter (DMT)-like permease